MFSICNFQQKKTYLKCHSVKHEHVAHLPRTIVDNCEENSVIFALSLWEKASLYIWLIQAQFSNLEYSPLWLKVPTYKDASSDKTMLPVRYSATFSKD